MAQYSTALSHIFLAATGLYCFNALNYFALPVSKVPFGVIALHSLLGIWRWGNPKYGLQFSSIYRLTDKLQDLLVLPSLATTIWLKYNYSFNFACAYIIVSSIPLILYLYDKHKHEPVDIFLIGNVLSLLLVSCYNYNPYGVSTSLSYTLSYFAIKRDFFINFPFHIPILDLYNYSMCFFSFFALKTILDPIDA